MKKIIIALFLISLCGNAHARTASLAPNMSGSLSPSTARSADNMTVDGVKLSSIYDYIYYGPKLYHDYTQRYIPTWQTFTRASGGTYFDATGILQTATTNEARYTHDPVTLKPLGLLYEEERKNYIRNSIFAGAVVGTGGTLPTNYGTFTLSSGLTREIVGLGTEFGMKYMDFRVYGTPTVTGTFYALFFEASSIISAVSGDVFTVSFYHRLIAGSASNVTLSIGADLQNGGAFTGAASTNFTTSSTLSRASSPINVYGATTNNLKPSYKITYFLDVPFDFTLRLYAPQCEKAGTVSSFITTTGTEATRSADQLSLIVPSGVTSIRYTFDDNTYQDVTQSYGSYTIPSNLNRPFIKRISGK